MSARLIAERNNKSATMRHALDLALENSELGRIDQIIRGIDREQWRANLFRCVGSGDTRGYLAWQPTRTPEPAFHLPAAFGWLKFT